ncbi:MAG: hypothetical protein WBO24_03750 [Nitrospirales bacterium]
MMMKHARRRTHAIVGLAAILCVPLGVYGQPDSNQGMPIQDFGQSGVLIREDKNQDAKFFSFMNDGRVQWRLSSTPLKFSRIDRRSDVSVRLVALDSVDGPPPCGADGYCNLNACSADPDCPAGLPRQESESEPYEPPHDEKGIGGSVWLTTGPDGFEGGHSCDPDKGTCNIKVTWSVQPDKYDKWKICWKDWGDTFTNACDVKQKIRKFENNFYVIPDLKEDHHYRIRLEGRKDSNDKWKCLAKARLRNVHLNGTNIRGVVPCIVP